MKARPILFKPHLLDLVAVGQKTQTRRVSRDWLKLAPGDVLWCKEKLMRQDAEAHHPWAEYARDGRYVEPSPFPWKWQKSWLSPLHMPKVAARVFLEVTEAPYLQTIWGINGADARAEGFDSRAAFLAAWRSIHPDARATDLVVVVSFKLRGEG